MFFILLIEKNWQESLRKQWDLTNKKFFIQVNTGRENKSGIYPEQLDDFINYCRNDGI